MSLTGCGELDYDMEYQVNSNISAFNVISGEKLHTADSFAQELCVVSNDVTEGKSVNMEDVHAAVLFDLDEQEVLYSKNAHERMNPASLTKVMTALVAIKYGTLDHMLTATDAVKITESGAQLCNLEEGDSMTLDQALRVLLIYSANDVAMLIAENVGGSVDQFIDMMNEEAKRLGATNTHFSNPHGLTEETHYTTAYDLYLIFNEAIRYDIFNEIIHMTEYKTTYVSGEGEEKEFKCSNTNWYLSGKSTAPDNVTVIGGKTGSTIAARSCLMLLAKDTSGSPYISVILSAKSRDLLYQKMTDLLDEINK